MIDDPDFKRRQIAARAQDLIADAKAMGVTLTIEAVPLKPLAMGNVEMVVKAWPDRAHQ